MLRCFFWGVSSRKFLKKIAPLLFFFSFTTSRRGLELTNFLNVGWVLWDNYWKPQVMENSEFYSAKFWHKGLSKLTFILFFFGGHVQLNRENATLLSIPITKRTPARQSSFWDTASLFVFWANDVGGSQVDFYPTSAHLIREWNFYNLAPTLALKLSTLTTFISQRFFYSSLT